VDSSFCRFAARLVFVLPSAIARPEGRIIRHRRIRRLIARTIDRGAARRPQTRTDESAVAAAAVRADRLHLARELHDIVGHAMSVIILQAGSIRYRVQPQDEAVIRSLATIESVGNQAMLELQALLGLMRGAPLGSEPAGNESAGNESAAGVRLPTLRDVDALVEHVRSAGRAVELVSAVSAEHLDHNARAQLAGYRIIQEALTNSVKHAGCEARTRIQLGTVAGQLAITVQDSSSDGTRPNPQPPRTISIASGNAVPAGGRGLGGMAERVGTLGGHLEAGPVAGGFLVRAELPLVEDDRIDVGRRERPAAAE